MKYQYKDSGVEWLGNIPAHWGITKLKRVIAESLKYGANESAELDDRELPRYIRITDFGDDGKLRDETFKSLPYEIANQYRLEEGDILFARSGATVGKTFQFKNYEGKACYAGYLIKAKPCKWLLDSDFLYYFTKSIGYDEWKNLIFTQATIQNIGADKYQYLPLTLPPLPEQKAIADYLDLACARIDRIIAIKEEQLEKIEGYFFSRLDEILTCKSNSDPDSQSFAGFIDRQIPTEWKIDRLRDLVIINDNALSNNTDPDFLLKYIDIGNVNKHGIVNVDNIEELSFEIAPSRARRVTCKYDTILSSVRTNLQAVAYIDMDIENLISSTGFFVCRPRFAEILKPKFLYYFLLTAYSKDYFFSNSTGVSYPAINDYRFGSIYIFVPPTDVQDKIIKRLDKLKTKASETASTIKSQIEQLKSYRKSLIHEFVTGKKQVADCIKIVEVNS